MQTVPLNENFSNRLETVCLGKTMGVDHGGNGTQNLELGIVPPDFVMVQNFKHRITCITM